METEKIIDNLIKENRAKMGLGLSRYVLGTVILLALVTGGLWLFLPAYTQFLAYLVVLILLAIASGLYPFFYHRNQAKTGAVVLCSVMFLAITVAIFAIPEIIPAAGIAYIAVMIIGKLLLGEKDSRWLNAAIVVALALVLIWGKQVAAYWFVPLDETLGIIFDVVVSLSCLVAVILFLRLVVGGQEEQFRQAQRTSMELESYKASLEAQVAARTAELQESLVEREQLHQQVLDSQQQLIHELSTPVIPIMEGVIVMPLVGSIDTMRARDVTRSLLAGISENQAKVVIVDITGVAVVDTGVVNYLNKTIQAARLKGARVIVTGISDAVAETIVELGIDWSNIETLRDLQTGLLAALQKMGVKLSGTIN